MILGKNAYRRTFLKAYQEGMLDEVLRYDSHEEPLVISLQGNDVGSVYWCLGEIDDNRYLLLSAKALKNEDGLRLATKSARHVASFEAGLNELQVCRLNSLSANIIDRYRQALRTDSGNRCDFCDITDADGLASFDRQERLHIANILDSVQRTWRMRIERAEVFFMEGATLHE